jgi:hypothetical protein
MFASLFRNEDIGPEIYIKEANKLPDPPQRRKKTQFKSTDLPQQLRIDPELLVYNTTLAL